MDNISTKEMKKLLRLLNVKGRCSLHQTAYALALVLRDEKYLSHVTKGLYQDVAKKYKTGWRNVERNIRVARDKVWNERRELLEEMSEGDLITRPSNTEFLTVLVEYLKSTKETAAALEIETALTDTNFLPLFMSMIQRLKNLEQNVIDLQNQLEILEAEKSSPKE